jgi:uncharacterized protein (TIGR03000 family)
LIDASGASQEFQTAHDYASVMATGTLLHATHGETVPFAAKKRTRSIVMFQRFTPAALAAAFLALAMTPSAFGQGLQNQQGWPFQGGGGSGGYYSRPVYSPPAYSQPVYSPPATTSAPPSTAGSMNTGFVSAEASNEDSALLNIRMPADAQLFFGSTAATNQSGSLRRFRSPPLDSASTYQYELRARWMQNGQRVERTRIVTIHANDVVNVDFTHGG